MPEQTIETSVSYTCTIAGHEDHGKTYQVPYSYTAYDSVEDAVGALDEARIIGIVNQTLKEDAGNVARENARRAGGHSTVKLMTPEEKAEAKAQRVENKALLDALRDNPELLAQLQGSL